MTGWWVPDRLLQERTGIPWWAWLAPLGPLLYLIGWALSATAGLGGDYIGDRLWLVFCFQILALPLVAAVVENLLLRGGVELASHPRISFEAEGVEISGDDRDEALVGMQSLQRPLMDHWLFYVMVLLYIGSPIGEDWGFVISSKGGIRYAVYVGAVLANGYAGGRSFWMISINTLRVIYNLRSWFTIEIGALAADENRRLFRHFNNMIVFNLAAGGALMVITSPIYYRSPDDAIFVFPFLALEAILVFLLPYVFFHTFLADVKRKGLETLRAQLAASEGDTIEGLRDEMRMQFDMVMLRLHPGNIFNASTLVKLLIVLVIEFPLITLALG